MADFEIERPSVELNQVNPTFNVNPPQFTIEIHGSIQGQRGEKGDKGDAGEPGRDGIDGINGIDGVDGEDGVGVESIVQTSTSHESGGTNIITATLTDGTETTFEIMNGEAGSTAQIKKFEFNDILDITSTSDEIYQELNECIANKEPFFITSGDDTHQVVYSYKYNNTLKIYYFATQTDMTTITLTGSPTVTVTYSDIYYQKLINQNNKLDYSLLSNTPTIPDELADLSDDSTHRLVTDAEKTTWNNKSNFSGSYNDLTNKPTIPTKTSELTNDSGYTTFSGSYTDLTDKPTIPSKTSDLTNDSGFIDNTYHDSSKQDKLVSGTSIKTINNQSLLGSGNINVSGGGGTATDVQINGASITSEGVANILTETAYSSSNKIATVSDLPTKTSDLTNDSGFITSSYHDSTKQNLITSSNKLDYSLVDNTPTIPTVPTNVSAFTNDSGYITGLVMLTYDSSTWQDFIDAYNSNKIVYCKVGGRMAFLAYVEASKVEFQYYRSLGSPSVSNQVDEVYVYALTSANKWTTTTRKASSTIAVGTGLSKSYTANSRTMTLSVDTSTMAQKSDLPTKTSDLTNDSGFITSSSLPTKVSDLTNDAGYITGYTETDPVFVASAAHGITSTDITNWNNKSTFSGNYNDLTNKPTIPTVNNATLTIQKNGTTVKTFTANASSNVTANITVPTKTSDITNDSGFVTSSSLATVATSGSYNDLSNTPTIPTVPTNVSAFTNDSGYITGITSSDIYNVLGYYPAAEPNIYTYSSIRQITSISDGTYISLMDDITNNRPIIIKLGTTEYVNALGTNNGTTTSLWYMTSDNSYTKITLTVSGTSVTVTHETIEIPTITLSTTTWIDSLF